MVVASVVGLIVCVVRTVAGQRVELTAQDVIVQKKVKDMAISHVLFHNNKE